MTFLKIERESGKEIKQQLRDFYMIDACILLVTAFGRYWRNSFSANKIFYYWCGIILFAAKFQCTKDYYFSEKKNEELRKKIY